MGTVEQIEDDVATLKRRLLALEERVTKVELVAKRADNERDNDPVAMPMPGFAHDERCPEV